MACLAGGVLVAAACAGRDDTSSVAPSFDVASTAHTISGQLLGPDGTSICSFIPEGSGIRIIVLDPISGLFQGQNRTCPTSTFSIGVPPGTYRLRASLPAAPGIVGLPFRYLEPGDVVVGGADVLKNIQVLEGSPLGGTATFDGAPFAGIPLDFAYDLPAVQQFSGLGGGQSGPDGSWDDAPPRSLLLQNGVRFRASGCSLLGARTVLGPPAGGFLFPTERGAIDCALETGPTLAFSHTLTRLVVTPMPGDIGGQSPELFGQFGVAWGVQFPVPATGSPVHTPVTATRLFRGGLIVGLAPDIVLAGFGYFDGDCGASCRDFGLDGTVTVKDKGSAGKRVTWHYSDAASLERVGLQVVQHSFDGQPPNDYVLFQFIFTNTSRSTLTFHAGFYGDWDLDDVNGPADDVGFTDLGGKLMYVTNNGEVGVHVGTMLLGDFPISGTYFVGTGSHLSLTDQVNALRGAITQTSLGPTDIRYFHSVGPITLRPSNKTAEIWIAIVAGENKAQLLANAAAAQADVASRK